MLIHSAEHKFFYIDPTLSDEAQGGGDGSSVAEAARHFPDTWEDNTIYLVRRSSVGLYANLPYSNSANKSFAISSFVVMGMPKSTDPMFQQIPEEAQLAWLDEDREYAYIAHPGNGRYSTAFTGCNNMHLSRVCLMENHTSNDENWCLTFTGGTSGTNMFIENCRFKIAGFDFTAENDTNNNNYYHGHMFLRGDTTDYHWANSAVVRNVVIDQWGRQSSIHCGYAKFIDIDNVKINTAQSRDNNAVITWSSEDWNKPVVEINNADIHLYLNDHCDGENWSTAIGGDVAYVKANNITIGWGAHQNHTAYSNRVRIYDQLQFTSRQTGSIIENVTANLPLLAGAGSRLIAFRYLHDQDDTYIAPLGQYNIVRHITFNMAETYPPAYMDRSYGEWVQNLSAQDDSGLVYVYSSSNYRMLPSSNFLLQDINIKAPMGAAIRAEDALFDLSSCHLQGTVRAYNCMGKIGSIASWYPGYAFHDGGSNVFYIGSITCNKNNPRWEYNSQHALTMSFYSYILTGACNTRYVSNQFNASDRADNCAYICTSNTNTGNYTVRGSYSQAETWSVNRTGSTATCSLKLSNSTKNDYRWPLRIGGEPFKGITMHAAAGDRKATIYMTLYGYNNPDDIKKKFNATLYLPDGSKVFSQEGNWDIDIESQWNDIDGSTSYKLEIPFHMNTEGDVEFSYTFAWYMADAAVYLDPYPVIS